MKIIITTQGNPEAGDPKHFTNIYTCEYFTIDQSYPEIGIWLTLFNGKESKDKKISETIEIAYDPETDTIVVLP